MENPARAEEGNGLLTLRDIAEQLGLPESTVRYYRDRFSAFVPTVGRGRQRRYREEAVEVLRTVAEGFRSQKSAEEVEEVLAQQFPRYLESRDEGDEGAESLPASWLMTLLALQGQALQQVGDALERLAEQAVAQRAEAEAVESVRAEVEDLRRRLAETVEARLARLEERDRVVVAQMRAYLDQTPKGGRLPWWQRWGWRTGVGKAARSGQG